MPEMSIKKKEKKKKIAMPFPSSGIVKIHKIFLTITLYCAHYSIAFLYIHLTLVGGRAN